MATQYISAMTALWNSSTTLYSAIKMNVTNAASGAGSRLLKLDVGGVEKFGVDVNGAVTTTGLLTTVGINSTTTMTLTGNPSAALLLKKTASGDSAYIQSWCAGTARWLMYLGNSAAETGTAGSYVGSNFTLYCYDNVGGSGSALPCLDINRASRKITGYGDLEVPGIFRINNSGTASAIMYLMKKGSGDYNLIQTYTGASVRWNFWLGDTAAESGGVGIYTGSNFHIQAYDNAGANARSYLHIARDTQRMTVYGPVTMNSTLNVTGAIAAASTVTAGSNFDSTSTTCILSATTGGAIYFRPNGPSSASEQMVLDSAGNLQINSLVSCALYLHKGTQTLPGGTPSGTYASIYSYNGSELRWRMDLGEATAETGAASVYTGSHFQLVGYDNNGGAGRAYFHINRDTMRATFYGDVYTASAFSSSSTTCFLTAQSGGSIYFRPNGEASDSEQMVLNANGGLILTPSQQYGLYVTRPTTANNYTIYSYGNSAYAAVLGYTADTNYYGMLGRYVSGVAAYSFYGIGTAFNSTAWTVSDARAKENIEHCDCATAHAHVKAIRVHSYQKKTLSDDIPAQAEIGWLAQDIEALIPQAVFDHPIPEIDTGTRAMVGSDTIKGTNDRTMLATLWAAFQHQAELVEALQAKVAALEGSN